MAPSLLEDRLRQSFAASAERAAVGKMTEIKRAGNSPQHVLYKTLEAKNIAEDGAVIKFKVHCEDGLLGTIEIGQGTLRWKAAKEGNFQAARLGLLLKMNGLQ